MSGGVFISYQREDSAALARLISILGRANALTKRVEEAAAIVVLIGENWLTNLLDDPNDHVGIEIETAFDRKIPVIPVLVDGASMPPAGDLPESLKPLASLQPIHEKALLERALAIKEKAFGPERPDTAGSLDTLTRLLRAQGDIAGARPLYERAPAIREKALGPKHPDAAGIFAKKTVRKGAAEKTAVKKTAAKKTAAKATRKSPAKKAARPAPAERDAAPGQPRGAVNQDLSVDEMKYFASARRAEAPPDADHPPARAENAQSADSLEEVVECSVFGPPAAPPGGTVLIQVFLHLAK